MTPMSSTPVDFNQVHTRSLRMDGRQVTVLEPGIPLWHLVHSVGEQVLIALDDLGFIRTGPLGQLHGFRIKELAVSPDGALALIHLDVTSVRLYDPVAPKKGQQGKPIPYLHLVNDKVVEQVRIRVSDLLGGRVDVWADNHYYVRYVVDLRRMGKKGNTFPSGDLIDHIGNAPGSLWLPLGIDQEGELIWHNLLHGLHVLLTGRTGGGKSTWLDAAICTLAHHTVPEQLQLAFLDAQKLNFSPYHVLKEYHFTDREGPLGVVWRPDDIVAAMVRLDREHRRRVDIIGDTPWGSIEDYNEHIADPAQRLPYVAVFTDELAVLRAGMSREQARVFDNAITSLIVGGRKVGFRLFLCMQYLKGSVIPPEVGAQAALTLAFWNSPQGSKNRVGDTSAGMLPGGGRFIVEGLAGGRKVLQGLYVDRETVLKLVKFDERTPTYSVDSIVLDVIAYALQELDGSLTRTELMGPFGHLMSSRRQMDNLLVALEQVGLALPADRSQVPNLPRRLTVESVEEAAEVLQFHPEVCFREEEGAEGLVFGPPGVR